MTERFTELIRILSIPGVGPRRTLDLVQRFGSLQAIFNADQKQLTQIPGITAKIAGAILADPDPEVIEGQHYLVEKFDVQLISIWDEDYPDILKQIYDPPIVLFCRGNTDLLQRKSIGIVGTRTPTRYGKEVAAELAADLSQQGYVISSGAAKGIDTIAHQSVLKVEGGTIAVLGNGLDRVYPAENRNLYEALGDHGLLISEFIMGTGPDAPNFPRRNRIISGLSAGTVVIEAAERSGSLITAYFALDQNREVFAVPGSIHSRQSRGTNQLIRQGAVLLENADQILEELGERFRLGSSQGQQALEISMDPKEESLIKHIPSDDPIHIDDLAQTASQTTFALLGLLLQMEMKGLVQQLPGKYFKRK
ncbi:MAG: DNA-processing protein DprA [Candidatus Marinimicrobia bacterium]|nr:DNA-processing protein DprA [Candidatus Neomarinimicrobiota bacterium]MCF7850981.1 DNA-processing protein DprA [Candidatus Neomarinimicrobiota bacterium]MCF7905134.1 DNA-processing protein DprA [Candidatus Neomarinimicrobiota bacterium]